MPVCVCVCVCLHAFRWWAGENAIAPSTWCQFKVERIGRDGGVRYVLVLMQCFSSLSACVFSWFYVQRNFPWNPLCCTKTQCACLCLCVCVCVSEGKRGRDVYLKCVKISDHSQESGCNSWDGLKIVYKIIPNIFLSLPKNCHELSTQFSPSA